MRVLHLGENVGLGRARNAGIEQATGDYLLFLDSDDTLAPGSLSAIARRLDTTDDPDVLIFDYTRTYWDGRRLPNQRADLLAETGPAAFSLADRPELLDLLQIVWNKAYRRDFITRHGFPFPPGYYEDAPWTYSTLIAAERLAVLDRICVRYRQRREGGNILRTVSRKHFDVFDQYDRVFAYLDAHPELDHWRTAVFRKMADHYLTIMEKPGRLPRDARSEFFHRGRPRTTGAGCRTASYAPRAAAATSTRCSAWAPTRRWPPPSGPAGCATGPALRRRERVGRAKRAAMGMFYRSQLRLAAGRRTSRCSPPTGAAATPATPRPSTPNGPRLAPHIRRVWVGQEPTRSTAVPQGVEVAVAGLPCVLDGGGPCQVPGQQRELRQRAWSSARARSICRPTTAPR